MLSLGSIPGLGRTTRQTNITGGWSDVGPCKLESSDLSFDAHRDWDGAKHTVRSHSGGTGWGDPVSLPELSRSGAPAAMPDVFWLGTTLVRRRSSSSYH